MGQIHERRSKEMGLQMKTSQLQQQAKQLREQASVQEHLAINAMRVETNRVSNNIMLSGIGAGRRIDAYTVEVPNTSVSCLLPPR